MSWSSFQGGIAPRRQAEGLAWRETGRGPPVLLIHGVGLNADFWEPQIAALAPKRRVVAPDLSGHGQSAALPADAGLDLYVAAMAELIDGLGLSPVPVVGHAFGATVALGLALDYPQKVAALVALNPVYCRDAAARAAVEGRAQRAQSGAVDVIGTLQRWFPDNPNGPLALKVASWLRAVDRKDYATAYRVFATADRLHEGRLGGLTCRALFMTGVADANSTQAMSERMAREAPHGQAPHGQALALPGARHMMPLTHPAETNTAILAFLNATPAI